MINKIDVATSEDAQAVLEQFRSAGVEPLLISGVSGAGTKELVFRVAELLEEAEADEPEHVVVPVVERRTSAVWDVERLDDGTFVVTGERIEKLVYMTKLDNHESLGYLHHQLERIGVLGKLRDLGVEAGDTVRIGEMEFDYKE
ncbi:MAG: Obg family GTPase CgtA [Armatimonadetes bacterium]|nr:Obg family GTPase CgtA [Armatimonadota bacterium]